jgi:hypothetical protein
MSLCFISHNRRRRSSARADRRISVINLPSLCDNTTNLSTQSLRELCGNYSGGAGRDRGDCNRSDNKRLASHSQANEACPMRGRTRDFLRDERRSASIAERSVDPIPFLLREPRLRSPSRGKAGELEERPPKS